MAMKILSSSAYKLPRNPLHSVRFTNDEMPRYKSMENTSDSVINFSGATAYTCLDSDTTSSENFQPAFQRFSHNEHRIKLLQAINQIVQQRAELETNRTTLSNLLDDLRKKLKRRIEQSHYEKKDKLKGLINANLRLEKEKYGLEVEVEHIKRHLEREEAHHKQHARKVMAQTIQGVTKGTGSDSFFSACSVANLPAIVSRNVAKNAPSRNADNKLAAARLMRDIAELRQRVAQVEGRLANEVKRKRQAEIDIIRLRKKLSSIKSDVASLRLPPTLLRHQCSKFA